MVALPNTQPVIDDVAGVEFIARRARETRQTKVYCYGAVTKGLQGRDLVEMGLLAESGAIGFTDGEFAVGSARVLSRALSYGRTFGLLIIQHPEEPTLAEGGAMNAGELATRLGLTGIPRAAEVILLERDLHLVELTGGRYHAAHLTTAPAIDAIRRAKKRGLKITCDTAPHYFALNELSIGDYRTFAKVSPPLRSEEDRRAVIAAVADGTIDCIASDHAPHSLDDKKVEFDHAAFGIVGLETAVPLCLDRLVGPGHLSLSHLVSLFSTRPARLLDLPGGTLAPGAPGDVTVLSLEQLYVVDPERFETKGRNTPFAGLELVGRAVATVVGGRVAFRA
jgi:dihydroorotase